MKIKGAIFDVDGTLLNSMEAWSTAAERYLKTLGVTAEPGLKDIVFPLTISEVGEFLVEHYGLDKTPAEVVKGIDETMHVFYLNEVEAKDGARELLDLLYENRIPMVIGSSTDRYLIEVALKRLDMEKYFDFIFTCTEVGAPKSKPDLFLRAMERLGTQPGETWVFEDGLYSIKTAKALGINTVGVYDAASAGDQEAIAATVDRYVGPGQNLASLGDLIRDA